MNDTAQDISTMNTSFVAGAKGNRRLLPKSLMGPGGVVVGGRIRSAHSTSGAGSERAVGPTTLHVPSEPSALPPRLLWARKGVSTISMLSERKTLSKAADSSMVMVPL